MKTEKVYGRSRHSIHHYGHRMDALREEAAKMGLTKEDAKKYGKLNLISTWEKLIEAHTPKQKRTLNRIVCLDCFGKIPDCQRCEGHGLIWNHINIRRGYFGKWRLDCYSQ
ncbi:MAG: hypothetical protein ACRCT1_09790 [Microcoleaceae cyanobacterium]|jgi:hypothetical protein